MRQRKVFGLTWGSSISNPCLNCWLKLLFGSSEEIQDVCSTTIFLFIRCTINMTEYLWWAIPPSNEVLVERIMCIVFTFFASVQLKVILLHGKKHQVIPSMLYDSWCSSLKCEGQFFFSLQVNGSWHHIKLLTAFSLPSVSYFCIIRMKKLTLQISFSCLV